MLSNDLHLRLHNRETRHASGIVSVRRIPVPAHGVPFWIRDTPRTGDDGAATRPGGPDAAPLRVTTPNEIEEQWQALLRLWPCPEELPGCPPSPRPLIEAAMECPELRRLYPFTRAYTLYFRRSPETPLTSDLPTAAPIDRDYFQAFAPDSWSPLGEGDAKSVAALMAEFVSGRG